MYTYEDRYSLHRYKADESYQIGNDNDPLKPYLDIDEIIHIAKHHGANAIHPGYGFLSESAEFARAIQKAGLTFIGPTVENILAMGDKLAARDLMKKAGVPIVPGSDGPITSAELAEKEAQRIGYPVIIKASAGGGGKGIRVVHDPKEMAGSFRACQSEGKNYFKDHRTFRAKSETH